MRASLGVLILAGGGGTRLWPLSRRSTPKPLLPLAGGVSMLRRAVALAHRIAPRRHVWIVTSSGLAPTLRSHLGPAAGVRFVVEPAPRNTAAALALGATLAWQRAGLEWVLCLPADQWVRRGRAFARLVRSIVARDDRTRLVTFGVPAASPNPGYGYIEIGKRIGGALSEVRRFVEKPASGRARVLVRSGKWVWNSGIFLWPTETFLDEVNRLLPRTGRAASRLAGSRRGDRRSVERLWRSLEAISVDHGILQRSARVAVACRDIGWRDLGSWQVVSESLPRARDGTAHLGRYLSIEGRDSFVYAPRHLTVNLGVSKVGLVVTPDCILMFDRQRHERVREVVRRVGRLGSPGKYT